MSNGRDFGQLVQAASIHYENLKTDITNAANRVEHIRLSALAQEAHNLLTDLRLFEIGLVYTHTANAARAGMEEDPELLTKNETQPPLDLPEFKSPFDPRHNFM